MDLTHGYEDHASEYIRNREGSTVGVEVVERWLETLEPGSKILDVGCGCGIPVAAQILAAGHSVYAIDASAAMVQAFKKRHPGVQVKCEAAERSSFFGIRFDAVACIGMIFLLGESVQRIVLARIAEVLNRKGRLLLNAPLQTGAWTDVMTGEESLSLGRDQYQGEMAAAGLRLLETCLDEGENNYYFFERS